MFHSKNFRRDDEKDRQYKEISKNRLINKVKKKFDTTIIGSLDAFEKAFGYLWGHGKQPSELTQSQLENRQIWLDTREKILDLGYSNFRATRSELTNHTIHWNRYITNFKMRDED